MSTTTIPGATKHSTGKARWGLLPIDALRSIIAALMFGAEKYGVRNWELGMSWHEPYDALMRHMTAWWERDPADTESGLSHLAHAGCCVLFLIAYEIRGIGTDNRPGTAKTKEVSKEKCNCGRCGEVGAAS